MNKTYAPYLINLVDKIGKSSRNISWIILELGKLISFALRSRPAVINKSSVGCQDSEFNTDLNKNN